jgi:hypothetical protein
MTCVWIGILSRLSIQEINKCLYPYNNLNRKPSEKEFVALLKTNNKPTVDVLWNGLEISEKMLHENLEWIRDYNIDNIYQGHDCSSADPFLMLISQLFCVDIHHNYNNSLSPRDIHNNGGFIQYTNKNNVSGMILSFISDKGHFW